MYMLFKLFKLFIIKKNSNNLFGLMFNKLSYIYIYTTSKIYQIITNILS